MSRSSIQHPAWVMTVSMVALLIAVMCVVTWWSRPTIELVLPASEFARMDGESFVVRIDRPSSLLYEYPSDNVKNGNRSRLLLLENGRFLGPPHSIHDDVRANGAGRYSHWDTVPYFSSSDGTDP